MSSRKKAMICNILLASFTCVAFFPLDAFKCIYMYLKHLINIPVFIFVLTSFIKLWVWQFVLHRMRNSSDMLLFRHGLFPSDCSESAFSFSVNNSDLCHLESKAISSLSAAYNKWLITAIKNQATGHYILNGKGEEVKSRSFIDLGVEWHYIIEGDVETLQTDGPLHDPVVVLVITLPYLSHSYMNSFRRLFTW